MKQSLILAVGIATCATQAAIVKRQPGQPPIALKLDAPGQMYNGLYVDVSGSQNQAPFYMSYISKYPQPYFYIGGNDQYGIAYLQGSPNGLNSRDNAPPQLVAVNNADGGKAFYFVTQEEALSHYETIDFNFSVGEDDYVAHTHGGDWAVCGSGHYVNSLIRFGDTAANCTAVKIKAEHAKPQ